MTEINSQTSVSMWSFVSDAGGRLATDHSQEREHHDRDGDPSGWTPAGGRSYVIVHSTEQCVVRRLGRDAQARSAQVQRVGGGGERGEVVVDAGVAYLHGVDRQVGGAGVAPLLRPLHDVVGVAGPLGSTFHAEILW